MMHADVINHVVNEELKQGIIDYAAMIGLTLGKATGENPYERLRGLLGRMVENGRKFNRNDLSQGLLGAALEAIQARENIHGTIWQRNDPAKFDRVTETARKSLNALFLKLT